MRTKKRKIHHKKHKDRSENTMQESVGNNLPCQESIKIVFDIARESMQQEKDRATLIMTKTQNLLKYISSTLGVVNTVLVFMVNQKMIDGHQWVWGMLLINIPLMASLICAVSAQIMLRGNYYPSGITALANMEAWNGNKDELFRYQVYQMSCMQSYTTSLNEANYKRAKLIKYGHVLYIISVVMILFSFLWFFWLGGALAELLKVICSMICR